MIERLIEGSARNPMLVVLFVLLFASWGLWAGFQVPLDAVPCLLRLICQVMQKCQIMPKAHLLHMQDGMGWSLSV